ncbi:MAG: hypothetical protein NTX05_00815 [Fusobacteria bacterium]|nr:hypothetical protein [Fusobacteriota bacterium]
MKKILLIGVLVAVGAQFVFADIVQGGLETSVSAGVNIPISYSESGVSFYGNNMKAYNSMSTGADLNVSSVYGIANGTGIGLGIGVLTLTPTVNSAFDNAVKSVTLGQFSTPSQMNIVPIYVEFKQEFSKYQMNPFVVAKAGYAFSTNPKQNFIYDSNGDSFSETYGDGLYISGGLGAYITQNIFAEADINYYQSSANLTFNGPFVGNFTTTDNINIFTTGLQLGYTF